MRTFAKHRFKRSRGSVIVLVVAVLALLVVIGTVYIVSARSERASANLASNAVNMDWAREAVDNLVLQKMASSMIDAQNIIGGNQANIPAGRRVARPYTMPEFGALDTGGTLYNGAIPNEPWLVSNLYRTDFGPLADTVQNRIVPNLDVSVLTLNGFNPNTGTYGDSTLAYFVPNTATGRWDMGPLASANSFKVVADSLPTGLPIPQSPTGAAGSIGASADALVQLLPFSEAGGIRYLYGVRILDTSRMANLNVGSVGIPGATAAPFNLNSISPIFDSWGNLNSNLRQWGTYITAYDLATDFINSGKPTGYLFNHGDYTAGTAANLQVSRKGTSQMPTQGAGGSVNASFAYDGWQRELFNAEPSPANGYGLSSGMRKGSVNLFDLTDELALRANGVSGIAYQSRPAKGEASAGSSVWPNTLSNMAPFNSTIFVSPPNFRRANYTTFSESRQLRPWPDPARIYTLTPTNLAPPYGHSTAVVWPGRPGAAGAGACVSANPPLFYPSYSLQPANPVQDRDAAYFAAMAATNLATAMEVSGFTAQDARAFAANYITYRWGSGSLNGSGYYELPDGPSFIDDQGVCVRARSPMSGNDVARNFGGVAGGVADLSSNPPTGLGAPTPGRVYLGYAAQPFINEVAANQEVKPFPTAADPLRTNVRDSAIELYNPYDVPLSLEGFQIHVVQGSSIDINLSGHGWFIPARGYFVLRQDTNILPATANIGPAKGQAQSQSDATLKFDPSGGTIYLQRKYIDRSGTPRWAPVDQYAFQNLMLQPTQDTDPKDCCLRRSNNDPAASINNPNFVDRWQATLPTPGSVAGPPHEGAEVTLGKVNPTESPAPTSLPLYDRYAVELNAPNNDPPMQASPLRNVMEFNRIMRVAHVIDATAPANQIPSTIGLVNDQIQARLLAPTTYMAVGQRPVDFPNEALIHFDFRVLPAMYTANTGYNANVYPPIPPNYLPAANVFAVKPGDIRANMLFDQLAFVDRVSDFSINIGDGEASRSKLRIPGQINVNTASADVLAGIPGMTPDMVCAIMAYRWRCKGDDPRIPKWSVAAGDGYQNPGIDFTDGNRYPGYGIRSLAELQVPLSNSVVLGGSPGTLEQRDFRWASVLNLCTVRSDTFVVYGYMEAVRVNPNYLSATNNPHNNSSDWYLPAANDMRDAVAQNLPNVRVARRRWVAIVDRSWSNDTNTPPRIVALRDMPN